MSQGPDAEATQLQAALRGLLDEADLASRELAVSDVIPEHVSQFVDSFDELLWVERPGHDAGVDPYLVEALLGGALVAVKALRNENPSEARDRLRLGLERVRQSLRDMLDEQPSSEDRPTKEIARWLVETVNAPQAELAAVLGTTPRTLQRWASLAETAAPTGDDEARLRIVAKLVNQLRHSFTAVGVIRWFERRHPLLGDRRPLDLLSDPVEYPTLKHLASRARSMVAT
jgi:hypothetical protein